MWFSGAPVLSYRFQVALDPIRLVIWGLACMAVHEKVKCEQYGPIRGKSRITCVAMSVCICASVFVGIILSFRPWVGTYYFVVRSHL